MHCDYHTVTRRAIERNEMFGRTSQTRGVEHEKATLVSLVHSDQTHPPLHNFQIGGVEAQTTCLLFDFVESK